MTAPTFTQLAASVGEIDTTDQLMMFPAYGKVFVVNGTNLKVIDFQNTKITTTDVGANPPDRGNTLTDGTSGAQMIVDYVTTLSGACTIYGYKTTTAQFGNGNTVTGLDDDGNAISFVTTAGVTPKSGSVDPHWYDWTVYGGDTTTYGTMPAKAYVGCLSGGRCILNNVEYPHQAPTSAAGNPFNWNIYETDADRATVIGTGSAGQIGDVVVALIPARDGMLVIGCNSSIHIMLQNPGYGGQLIALPGVGIFGSQSWCFDEDGNLFFWGTGGVYRLAKGATELENVTAVNLPDLVRDTAANPTTHRITMGYDLIRRGIRINITVLADGTSTNYWLDLNSKGIFPETYGAAHGTYSSYFYNANDPTYRGLLIGCTDGYIRVHDDDVDSDDGTAINAYVDFGPIQLADDGRDGSIEAFDMVLAGGASGSLHDSANVDMRVYAADTAEEVLEKLDANTGPNAAFIFNGPGRMRGGKKRRGARGAYIGMKVGNRQNERTWGMEKIILDGGAPGKRLQ